MFSIQKCSLSKPVWTRAFSVPDYLTVCNTIIDRQEICKNNEDQTMHVEGFCISFPLKDMYQDKTALYFRAGGYSSLERISRFGVSRTVNFLSHLKRMFWRSAVMGHALRRHE